MLLSLLLLHSASAAADLASSPLTPASAVGLRSHFRDALDSQKNQDEFLGEMETPVWFLWHNENKTTTYTFDCAKAGENDRWIRSPFPSPVTVRNLLYPYDTVDLSNSQVSFFGDNKTPFRGWSASRVPLLPSSPRLDPIRT